MTMTITKKLTITLSLLITTVIGAREIKNFDANWLFHLGDAKSANNNKYNDTNWQSLNVPHDWAFEADYSAKAAQTDKGGYKPGGIAWYRKKFNLPKNWQNKHVRIAFSGVFMNSEVWINGHLLGKRPYGYISFEYNLSKYLKPEKNIIAVRVDSHLEPAARWYHGCGIYGHVKLIASNPLRIANDGIFVSTPTVSNTKATVLVKTEVENNSTTNKQATLQTIILTPAGKVITKQSKKISISAGKSINLKQNFTINNPQRWHINQATLYSIKSKIIIDNQELDLVTTRFGVRTIRWDAKTGFWLNDKNIKLKGVCDHSEAGPVGAAYPDELLRWKIKLLKEMGCNAIRTAHNPQTPIFYDICDEEGILVMDEIFDGWGKKSAQDYGKQAFKQCWEKDLRDWIKRDRNHPCIIIWSLGNETHGAISKDLVRVCHEVDPTRLTTSGRSGSADMDVLGVNGSSENQQFFRNYKPTKPLVATEAPHTWQVRGFYRSKTWWRFRKSAPKIKNGNGPFPCPDLTDKEIFTYDWIDPTKRRFKQQFNPSYDTGITRITARKHWELVRDNPWHAGHFRWTGFDYIGEAGYVHGGWPFRAFMGGPLDLAGFKKDLFYFYQSQWTTTPMLHILPHWTHPNMQKGTEIPVWVYSNCDEVELFLNGKSLGKDQPGRKWNEMQCEWLVPWTPGKLIAVGYKNGKEILRSSQITAQEPAKLKMSASGKSCPIISVAITDKEGIINPYAENRVHYHIAGPARILSLESGNPVNTENNTTKKSRTTFFGLGRAFLKTTAPQGEIDIIIAAICGEKQLMTSNKISIDVQQLAIRGKLSPKKITILYSIDGSKPSLPYSKSFIIQKESTVKANIFCNDKLIISMTEKFGKNEGLYWGDKNGKPAKTASRGEQAEDAKLKNATISKNGKGFNGKGFVILKKDTKSSIEWYQENDGASKKVNLTIRYSGKNNNAEEIKLELNINGKPSNILLPNSKKVGKNWKTIKTKITISAGANSIIIKAPHDANILIDEITIGE